MFILRAILDAHRARKFSSRGRVVVDAALFHVHAGGCDLCAQEVNQLTAFEDASPVYRFNFVSSPYEANFLVLSGTLTRAALDDVLRIWSVMPEPKGFIAVGDCARGQDKFSETYAVMKSGLLGQLPEVVERQIAIAGCPPTLPDIAHGLATLCAPASKLAPCPEDFANEC